MSGRACIVLTNCVRLKRGREGGPATADNEASDEGCALTVELAQQRPRRDTAHDSRGVPMPKSRKHRDGAVKSAAIRVENECDMDTELADLSSTMRRLYVSSTKPDEGGW